MRASAEAGRPLSLEEVNRLPRAGFIAELGAIFEHSPWVAERAFERRPFGSVAELHRSMMEAVREAPGEAQLALLRAHPELAGAEAKEGTLTPHSSGEQGRLGFACLSAGEFRRIADLNRRYREKFGFPCIIALALHATRASVLDEMERRLATAGDEERRTALEQIGHITGKRLATLIREE